MPHTKLITGGPEQLEDALAGAIEDARAVDGLAPVTVLIGGVLMRPYLRRMLAARGVALLNVHMLRPNELAQTMAWGAAPPDRPRLTRGAERLLVREVAASAEGYFARIAGRDGFAQALGRLFRELEQGGFDPAAFEDAASAVAPDARAKTAELARLYGVYRERLTPFATAADDYAAAMRARLDGAIVGPLVVHGLWAPTTLQWRLIQSIAQHTDVTVLLPATGTDADDAHAAFRVQLDTIGATHDSADKAEATSLRAPSFDLQPSASSTQLPLLADTGTNGPVQPPTSNLEPPSSTSLVSAPDTVREVWEAARTCLRLSKDGVRFHEMAVVYRNAEPYRALVQEIFDEAGIGMYLHDGRLLSEHPLGRRVLSLLELAAAHETFGRARVMEFLTETRLPRETRERAGGRVRPSEWDSFTREAGVVEGIEQWRTRLAHLAAGQRDKAAQDERVEHLARTAQRVDALIAFVEELHAALAERPEEATWQQHLDFLRRLAERYADGTGPIIDALRDVATLAAVRETVSFEGFCRAVRDDLETRDASRVLGEPVRLFGREGVAVLDAASARQMRFRRVYLLGVAERAWPPPQRPDPLLLEHERRAINAAAGGAALPLRTEPDSEALTFASALHAAREETVISYARADAGHSGKHLPSYYFRGVAEALEGRHLTLDELDASPHVRRLAAGRLASDDLTTSLSQAEYDRGLVRAAGDGSLSAGVAAIEDVAPTFRRARRARELRMSRALSAYDGVMIDEAAAAAALQRSPFAAGETVSASRLEMYARCSYQYFMRYTLGISPVEEPERIDRLDHLERGNLIHEVLATFMTRLRDAGERPAPDQRARHLPLLMEVARECGDERVRRGVTGRALIWAMDKQSIDEDLIRWYDEEASGDASFAPAAFEARFGPDTYGRGGDDPTLSSDEPLVIRTGAGQIRVLGRIDRIDVDDTGGRFRVTDYKTGKHAVARASRFKGGEQLQLPIYLLAAAQMLELPSERGAAEYYYVSSAGGFKRLGIGGAEFEQLRPAFEQILATIADGADTGYFAPRPEKKRCEWCDYQLVCGPGIERTMKRKEGDPRGDNMRAIEVIP